jgi:hypothetical protein
MRVVGQGLPKRFYLKGRRGRYKLLDICWQSRVGEWQKALASSPTSSPCSVPMYNAEIKIRRLAFRISDYMMNKTALLISDPRILNISDHAFLLTSKRW